MERAEEWRRLCDLLEDDDAVWQSVRTALEQGREPWEALLDGLDEAGALAYLQADDTGMELTDALAQLPRVVAIQPDLDEATDTDDLTEATAAADRALAGEGLRVLLLVEGDDSWPLVIVPEERVAEIRALVEGVGHDARGTGG